MNRKINYALLALATAALLAMPLASANCAGWVEGKAIICGRNPSTSPDDPCVTITGLNIDIRDVTFTSIGICQDQEEISGLPLACDGSGAAPPVGATAFITSDCTGMVGCNYKIWATQNSGVAVSGWGLAACTNRDDSGKACTDIGSNLDDFSSKGGVGFIVSGGGKKDDPVGYAQIEYCVRRDTQEAGSDMDDMYVFVSVWADENIVLTGEDDILSDGGENENLGAGVSFGTYDIWVEKTGSVSSQALCYSDVAKQIPHTGDTDPNLPS